MAENTPRKSPLPEPPDMGQNVAVASGTPVTMEMMLRENLWLLRDNQWLRTVIDTRLDAMDKALILLQTRADKVPSETDVAVGRLKELHEAKFSAVDARFSDSSSSVKTAFDAAKELVGAENRSRDTAINKSEAAFTKLIEAINTLVETKAQAQDDKFDDLKTRVQIIESVKNGVREVSVDNRDKVRDQWGVVGIVVGALIGAVGLFFGLK